MLVKALDKPLFRETFVDAAKECTTIADVNILVACFTSMSAKMLKKGGDESTAAAFQEVLRNAMDNNTLGSGKAVRDYIVRIMSNDEAVEQAGVRAAAARTAEAARAAAWAAAAQAAAQAAAAQVAAAKAVAARAAAEAATAQAAAVDAACMESV